MTSQKPQSSDCDTHVKAENAESQGSAACDRSEGTQGLEPTSAILCPLLAPATTLPPPHPPIPVPSHPLHKALMQPSTGPGCPSCEQLWEKDFARAGAGSSSQGGPGKIRAPPPLARLQAFWFPLFPSFPFPGKRRPDLACL